jgi:hypothetical protein
VTALEAAALALAAALLRRGVQPVTVGVRESERAIVVHVSCRADARHVPRAWAGYAVKHRVVTGVRLAGSA